MKRWTNGLPGATKRLGAKMALRGLAASQPRMRADTHDGPEQIAPLQRPDTLMQLSRSLISEVHLVPHGRAIHFGTKQTYRDTCRLSAFGVKRTCAVVRRIIWDFRLLSLLSPVSRAPHRSLWPLYQDRECRAGP